MDMKTLKRDLEVTKSTPINNVYKAIPANKSVDTNYSSFTNKKIRKVNILKKDSQSESLHMSVKNNLKLNIISIIKKYLLTFFIFIILSHQEFDIIVNIDEMNIFYRILLKALIFTIIQIILNISL
tara:strand:- start:443 stop:820 length:378 start_codon:yes stop_codon:yes gene_type:complete